MIVTGAVGLIGMHTEERLLDRGETVIGVDNFNDYYDPALKEAREGFTMVRADIADHEQMPALMSGNGVKLIVHPAARAGVRYSIKNPFAYERSNLAGHGGGTGGASTDGNRRVQ